jgi:anti-anti-sigma factor
VRLSPGARDADSAAGEAEAMTPHTLSLGGDLTILRAAELRETLLARLAQAPRVLALDLAEVGDFDSAGVQLLLATRRALDEAGAQLAIVAASPTVRASLALFGLGALLAPAAEGAAA